MLGEKCNFLHEILLKLAAITILIHHVSADDADVMANFAKSITPTPSGWSGSSFCKWQGINCDSSGRVNSINLSSKLLSGIIPSDINQLSNLKSLSLQGNSFSGPLPSLSNINSIQLVNLDDNMFDSIPPYFLSGLTSLQQFSIENNTNLPPWKIPESLKDSTTLVSFQASKANVVGEIPDIFGSLPNLQSLRISYNNMSGPLPASFAKSGIQNLSLNNQMAGLVGQIDVLGTMTQLTEVWLHANKFSGPIPDLSACTELSDLQLRENLLTGVIPYSLTTLPKLQGVALQNNKFQGPIPTFPKSVQVNLGTSNSFCNPFPGPCDAQVTILLEVAGALGYPMALAESWEKYQHFLHMAATGRVTTKVDVFAFGVVLMEIITGRKALDDSLPEEQCQLVTWFRRLLADKDPVKAVLDPTHRPDMSHAVNVLSPLVEQWQPVMDEEENFGIDFHMSLSQVVQKWKANELSSSTSRLDSDFYNDNSNDYSTSSDSTGTMMKTSEFSSSHDMHISSR